LRSLKRALSLCVLSFALSLAILPILTAQASGNSGSGPTDKDTTAAAAKPPGSPGPSPPDEWKPAEVEAALKDCAGRLSALHAVYEQLEPLKEGACGLPSPIRLKGFETAGAPALQFLPEPTISCKLTEALRHWLDDVVQRSAKAHLDATIIRISNLSAYICRTRYDDPAQKMSQHAYGNAIDLGEFVTAKGERITVLEHWDAGDEHAAFLHEIHDGACKIFGTTLGPKANEAHKNHFHLDMIERRHPLCDFAPGQQR
jgi:hypothetical protein